MATTWRPRERAAGGSGGVGVSRCGAEGGRAGPAGAARGMRPGTGAPRLQAHCKMPATLATAPEPTSRSVCRAPASWGAPGAHCGRGLQRRGWEVRRKRAHGERAVLPGARREGGLLPAAWQGRWAAQLTVTSGCCRWAAAVVCACSSSSCCSARVGQCATGTAEERSAAGRRALQAHEGRRIPPGRVGFGPSPRAPSTFAVLKDVHAAVLNMSAAQQARGKRSGLS
jgi:hypothetical protein